MSEMFIEEIIPISKIQELLEENIVQVESPDGWVDVNFFVDKGNWEEYLITTSNGLELRCNESHLFKCSDTDDWVSAKVLDGSKPQRYIQTIHGPSLVSVVKTGNIIPIVDINVNHENHRYYTAGIESHNTGAGKSRFMCHAAANNLRDGYNVLYITLEMSDMRIAERIDSNLLDVTLKDIVNLSRKDYDYKINKFKETCKGKLIIKEYPSASASATHFKNLLNELKQKKNFTPDIIYIDYINICASSRLKNGVNAGSYTYIKYIAEEFRGLATEFNVPVFTATQTNRGGFNSSDVGLEDTAESFGLPATADFMFALITNDELAQMNQILVKQLKNRYGNPDEFRKFFIGVDAGKMRHYDLDDSAQKNLIDGPVIMDANYPKPSFNFEEFK